MFIHAWFCSKTSIATMAFKRLVSLINWQYLFIQLSLSCFRVLLENIFYKYWVFFWKILSCLHCIVVVVEVIGKATQSERRKKGFFSRSDKSSLVWNLLVKYIRIRHTFPRFYLSPVHSEIFWVEIVWSCNKAQFSKIMLIDKIINWIYSWPAARTMDAQ